MRRKALSVGVAAALLLTSCAASGDGGKPTELSVPAGARAYFFGDSWTAGVSAAEGRGFPEVTSEMLGWRPTIDGVGGTGFLRVYTAGTKTLPERAEALKTGLTADIVIVEGGLNDQQSDLTSFRAKVVSTLMTLKRKFPGKPIVMVGPPSTSLPTTAVLKQIDAQERAAAVQTDVTYISPLREGWFTQRNLDEIMDPSTNHPNTAGHAYFGGRLALALQMLETSAPS